MKDFDFRQTASPKPKVVGRTTTAPQRMVVAPAPAMPAKRLYFRPRAAKPPSPWWRHLQLAGLLVGVLAGGFVAQTLAVGLVLLAGYALAALMFRIPSRTSFTLALLLLVAISLLLLFKPIPQLASNFATYAFILLLIGVVTLGREAKMPKRRRRTYQR